MPYLGVGSIIGVEAGPSFCLGKQRNEQTFTVGNSNYRTGRLCSNRVFDAALDSLKCLEPNPSHVPPQGSGNLIGRSVTSFLALRARMGGSECSFNVAHGERQATSGSYLNRLRLRRPRQRCGGESENGISFICR